MKKLMIIAVSLLVLAISAVADSDVQTVGIGNATGNTSGVFQASGWLDRFELSGTSTRTCTVTVASYDANDVAIETYVNGVQPRTSPVLVQPRTSPGLS